MAVSIHERFENHIDTASPETSGDAKRETDTEEDPYDKGFEEKLTLARIKGAEQQDSGIEKNEEDDSPQKRRISTFSRETKNYTMNSHATIEGIRDRYDENGKKWFDSVLDSGVGGIDGWKVRLKGALESERYVSYNDRFCYTPIEGDRGKWEGDRAESKFVPSETTEAGRAAKEKLQEYGLDGITYKDAEPDFSKCSEATVTIDHMTDDRMGNNFPKADANCAEQWNIEKKDGRINWDAADVRDWRRENNCSWHECCDTRTMMLVPTEIHGYFRHSGGVAECKARDNADVGGGFDE